MKIIGIVLLVILLVAVVSTLNAVCFFIGAKVRQKVDKGEPIELPELNPIKVYEEHQEKRVVKEELNRNNIILSNIEHYDGTEYGQKDVP